MQILTLLSVPERTNAGDCEFKYAMNHLVYEEFLPAGFSRRVETSNAQDRGKFPKSLNSLTWHMIYYIGHANSNIFTTDPRHIAKIEAVGASSSVLNASLAFQIDTKIDDGKPLTGIVGNFSTLDNCITGTAPSPVNLYASSTTAHCNLTYSLED